VRFGERATEDREVLGKNVNHAAIDRAPAGHDSIARDPVFLRTEFRVAVLDEHVELLEGIGVEKELDPLAGGELAAVVLGLDPRFPAAHARPLPPLFELLEDMLHRIAPPDACKRDTLANQIQRSELWRCAKFHHKEHKEHEVIVRPGTAGLPEYQRGMVGFNPTTYARGTKILCALRVLCGGEPFYRGLRFRRFDCAVPPAAKASASGSKPRSSHVFSMCAGSGAETFNRPPSG